MKKSSEKVAAPKEQIGIRKISKEEERRLLLAATEQKITEPFWDENLDKALEKFSLTEYKQHNPKFSLVIGELKSYKKKFPLEFYRQVYRLNGWAITDTSLFERPGIVGKWTNDIIYLRFPPGTLKILQQVNPIIGRGIRLHKHFQCLTDNAEELLDKFIDEAIQLMGQCGTWADFKARFAKELGHPYQLNFFEGLE